MSFQCLSEACSLGGSLLERGSIQRSQHIYKLFLGGKDYLLTHQKITANYKEQTFPVNDFCAFLCIYQMQESRIIEISP